MRKKIWAMAMVTVLSFSTLVGCGSSGKKDAESTSSSATSEKETDSTAVTLTRTANPDTIILNNEKGVFDKKKNSSWVKIATIWDPELTIYDASSFTQDSKAVVVDFEVSGLDIKDMTCYWNYMVADSNGVESECWDTKYKTDDVKITEDGTYRMVFDYTKTDAENIAEIKSLQLVFPGTSTTTTMKVKVTNAVCVMDEKELGTTYQTGEMK